MNLIEKLAFWRKPKHQPTQRQFDAGALNRLTADWLTSGNSADSEIRYSLKELRNRCRDLERNNDYARRYFKLLQNNVLGSNGIGLQMKVRERVKEAGKWVERYDMVANKIIEDAHSMWRRPEYCSLSGAHNFIQLQQIALTSTARDGACLFRKHYPKDNPFLFSLEPIEIDQLDIDRNETHKDGSVTSMGIRKNQSGKVVGYWLLRSHPGELFQPRANGFWTEYVDAKFIIHLYRPERVGQSTGFPWLVSTMVRLKNLGQYEAAELVASRVSAAKMGFIINTAAQSIPYSGAQDSQGRKYMEVEPGSIEELPFGKDFRSFDPNHPSTAFKDFVKATLRGISAGLGVSYTSLANDLESVNYSSIRAGLLEEREEWKTVQGWFIDSFIRPIFEEWLSMAASSGALKNNESGLSLPAAKVWKWNQPEFKARRWDWVDPLSDLQASVLAVEKGFKSRRQIISEAGGDVEDTFGDIAADESLEEEYGLDFSPESGQQANKQQSKPDAPDDAAIATS
jgi:lambda family phage portal protein